MQGYKRSTLKPDCLPSHPTILVLIILNVVLLIPIPMAIILNIILLIPILMDIGSPYVICNYYSLQKQWIHGKTTFLVV